MHYFISRIRNDLPNYLSEREADGVSVMSWYHRQFRDAARERYFKNMNMATYFHSSIADYYLGKYSVKHTPLFPNKEVSVILDNADSSDHYHCYLDFSANSFN